MEKRTQVIQEDNAFQEICPPPYKMEKSNPITAQPNQSPALSSHSRQEEPQYNKPFYSANAQMTREDPFAARAEAFPDHQMQYQQPALFNQFPQQTMQTSPAADVRQQDQYSQDLKGNKKSKSSNVKGAIGGGLLGFALTGRLSGLAGGAVVGNLVSKSRK